MKEEHDALIRNQTWVLVPMNCFANLVDCRWFFHIKYLPNGSVDWHKDCLVVKGFTQRPGIDYHSTFNLVIKPATVHPVLTIAIQNG